MIYGRVAGAENWLCGIVSIRELWREDETAGACSGVWVQPHSCSARVGLWRWSLVRPRRRRLWRWRGRVGGGELSPGLENLVTHPLPRCGKLGPCCFRHVLMLRHSHNCASAQSARLSGQAGRNVSRNFQACQVAPKRRPVSGQRGTVALLTDALRMLASATFLFPPYYYSFYMLDMHLPPMHVKMQRL